MGFTRRRRRKLIIAERSKPYVSRWMAAYFIRRAKRIDGELPRRPMIWTGATYINKDAPNNFTWVAHGVAYGEVIEDVNRGGGGVRWAVLHAFADRVGDYGRRRAAFIPYHLLSIRGLSVDIASFSATVPKATRSGRGDVAGGNLRDTHG